VHSKGGDLFKERLSKIERRDTDAIPWIQFKIDRRIGEIRAGFKSRARSPGAEVSCAPCRARNEIIGGRTPRRSWAWTSRPAQARLQITDGARLEYVKAS